MLTETKIKSFLVLSERLNFSKAAEQLFVSQQALSAQIAALEADTGLKLFVRSTSHVELTEAGRALCAVFRDAEHAYAAVRAQYLPSQEHLLRVGCFEDADLGRELIAASRKTAEKHGPVSLDIQLCSAFADLMEMIDGGQLDLAVFPAGVTPSKRKYQIRHLEAEPIYLFVSPQFPGAHAGMTLPELKDAAFFVSSSASYWRSALTDGCLTEGGFQPRFEGSHTPGVERLMVESGEGVGTGGRFSLLYRNPVLIRIPWLGGARLSGQVAIWRRGVREPLLQDFVRALIEMMHQTMENDSGEPSSARQRG